MRRLGGERKQVNGEAHVDPARRETGGRDSEQERWFHGHGWFSDRAAFNGSMCLRFFCAMWIGLLIGCSETESDREPASASGDPAVQTEPSQTTKGDAVVDEKQDSGDHTSLFDGKTMEGWESINFGGEGECLVEDGNLVVEMGDPMTGLRSTLEDLPRTDYEFEVEAQRMDGVDFFCAVTFPYKDSHCSFIVGGWAGSTVGLSCINDQDASNNETKKLMSFEEGRWYRIRIRVVEENISCWIDDEQVVDLNTNGKKITLRNDSSPTRPLSLYAFQTRAAYRNVKLKRLKP